MAYHGDGEDWWFTVIGDDDEDDEPFLVWLRRSLALAGKTFFVSLFITPVAHYIWSFMRYAIPHF